MGMFDNYINIPADYTPDNRHIRPRDDGNQYLVIGGTNKYVFKYIFDELNQPDKIEVIFRNGIEIFSVINKDSLDIETKEINESFIEYNIKATLESDETAEYIELGNDVKMQIKFVLNDNEIRYSEPIRLVIVESLDNSF